MENQTNKATKVQGTEEQNGVLTVTLTAENIKEIAGDEKLGKAVVTAMNEAEKGTTGKTIMMIAKSVVKQLALL